MNLMINYSHKWWYKALTVLLILAILVMITIGAAPKAKAVGVLTLTVCAAILAVMAGAGIATVVSGMTSADIQSWLNGKLNEWDTYRNDGNIFTDLINGNLITATVKGTLAIGNAAASGISDFIDWLKTDLSLIDNSTITVIGPNINGISIYPNNTVFSTSNGYTFNAVVSNSDVILMFLSGSNFAGNFTSAYISHEPFTIQFFENNVGGSIINSRNQGNYYYCEMMWKDYYSNLVGYNINNWSGTWSDLFNYLGNSVPNNNGLILDTDIINIPDVSDPSAPLIVIGIDGVYPGANTDQVTNVILEGVETNTLDVDMELTEELSDAQEVYVINEQPISVNTDHHMIGFTNLPDFQNLNLNSIWHYVSDAVEFASNFISWFINLITAVPVLAIPLYMSFTLLIVLSFIRRILL